MLLMIRRCYDRLRGRDTSDHGQSRHGTQHLTSTADLHCWVSSLRNQQNALLKTVEEPPSASTFILVSSMPDSLLPTVRSRCPRLRFGTLSPDEVESPSFYGLGDGGAYPGASSRWRRAGRRSARCRQLLGTNAAPSITGETLPTSEDRDRYESLTGVSLRRCPVCEDGHMIATLSWPRTRLRVQIPHDPHAHASRGVDICARAASAAGPRPTPSSTPALTQFP